MATKSWKEIADLLGDRMANHRYCNVHRLPLPAGGGCPFCDDIAAYVAYCQKLGRDPHPEPEGPSIDIFELRKQMEESDGQA